GMPGSAGIFFSRVAPAPRTPARVLRSWGQHARAPRTETVEALFSSSEQDPDAIAGSNNWVVAGRHAASGRAMLANDPHLNYAVPPIWYTVHLQAPGPAEEPGMDVAGVSLPGMPAVIIGHNAQIAWGMTNLGADVQDVYIEKFDPKDSFRYLVAGEWQRAEERKERIIIRGEPDREVGFTVTRHGPIVLVDGAGAEKKSYALRWVATEKLDWTLPFFRLNAARNWEEFRAALAGYPGPAQNFVYADAAGNIGYQAAGMIPIRPRGDGSVPLEGHDLANDWRGYIPFEELPSVYNPPSGMIATANGRVVPDGYAYPVATKWDAPDRTERIYELLNQGAARKFRAGDFARIQSDVHSRHYKE
ncbi:MAG: penicillin acylase family protein, partial [Gammaproteobacteria bacterium]